MSDVITAEALDDIYQGLVFGFLAITDDKELTLAKVGKLNPWQIDALKIITGNEERAHRPLSEILKELKDLEVDCHIDVSGTKGGHFFDTQGFIAHNDDTIVLSYRCTVSIFDWLTNFQTTTSVWEVEEDYKQGHSGRLSGFGGLLSRNDLPRVHTGFYNNFLASLPMIKEHVEPLLSADQPPRKLFVTGHSLGAGLASLATCYFLEFFDWNNLPHSFCSVTAGSPRACGQLMQEMVQGRIKEFDSSKVQLYRLVKEKDVVATLPPEILGFRHFVPPIVIQTDGKIVCSGEECGSRSLNNEGTTDSLSQILKSVHDWQNAGEKTDTSTKKSATATSETTSAAETTETETAETTTANYQGIPEPLRDHFPESYLNPVSKARGLF